MIHHRRIRQIAPGRHTDAIALAHDWAAIWKETADITFRVSVVTTGTLGRICMSADFQSMGAFEEAAAKAHASPKAEVLGARQEQEERDGTSPRVANTTVDEFWRDA